MSSSPELLAPAGDADSMRAAVCNGADAVYFGVGQFNARQRAVNPRPEELAEVVRYLHAHNVKAYVAFNTLIYSHELEQAAACVRAIAESGADAVIVQDLGLLRLIREMAPSLPIHASTQMSLSDAHGIEFVRSMGVCRVIMARELSIEQIGLLNKHCPGMELEAFIHGAICMSFSGQCTASQSLWNRSANRGLCGQACRLPYKLIVDGQEMDKTPPYLLSTKDLSSYDLVAGDMGTLKAVDLAGLKIEGRLKSAHYVAAAVQAYRCAIDGKNPATPATMLEQTFSRGFCHGFLDGVDHQELVYGFSPRNIGVPAGKVIGTSRCGLIVQVASKDIALKSGDGVVFDVQSDGQPIGGRIYSADVFPARGDGSKLELTFDNNLDLSSVPLDCRLWKTDDPQLERQLQQSFSRDVVVHAMPLHVQVRGQAGQPLELTFSDGALSVTIKSDQPLQAAQKHPLTHALAAEQLARLGGTPFSLGQVELVGPQGPCPQLDVMVPKSVLNSLRRDAIERLIALRHEAARHRIVKPNALEEMRAGVLAAGPTAALAAKCAATSTTTHQQQCTLTALVRTLEQLQALAQLDESSRPAMIYADFSRMAQFRDAVEIDRRHGLALGLASPRVTLPGEEHWMADLAAMARQCKQPAMLVRNLGYLSYIRRHHADITVIADASLNAANEIAVDCLRQAGATRITPAYELDLSKLLAVASRCEPSALEAVIYQHVPMMHTVHCLFAANVTHGHNCRHCSRPCETHSLSLRDRNGVDHPVWVDLAGRNTIFKGAVELRMNVIPRLMQAGVRTFRLELLDEGGEEALQLWQQARQAVTLP